jgi:hypothetical protein
MAANLVSFVMQFLTPDLVRKPAAARSMPTNGWAA